jgi:hypothetical protein
MLRNLRQDIVALGESRFNFYLASVSGVFVGFSFLYQSGMRVEILFYAASLGTLGLLCVGFVVFGRLVERSISVIVYTRGMNRIRRYFVEIEPKIEPHVILGTTDDSPFFGTVGHMSRGSWAIEVTAPVAIINSSLLSIFFFILSRETSIFPIHSDVMLGVFLSFVAFFAQIYYQKMRMDSVEKKTRICFPGK